jgi:hypothetical protein
MLRDYQQRTIDQLYAWFSAGNAGNPCVVMPTGAGKSHIVAALCKDAIQNWPETRILMLTHVKELISQNAEKMRLHWPGAPLGIYSAGLGSKRLDEPITFAGIQSIRSRASQVGHIDLCIIDECHLVSHKDEGGYRTFLAALKAINPALRVVGLTATPYRLGHGLITDAPALFHALIEPERERLLGDFKSGRLRALTNANVLTTGFDYPDMDLIAMLRPTMSPSLYVQMAGRGMRVKSHTDHCLVLDFAGVVQTHGPITAVNPNKPKGDGNGDAPVKVCDNCGELVHISAKVCPACGAAFPEPQREKLKLRDDDIMGLDAAEMALTAWNWRKHTSRSSGKDMLAVSYYGGLSDPSVVEYFPITHSGYAGEKALNAVAQIAERAGAGFAGADTLEEWANRLNGGDCPSMIEYRRDGKYYRVIRRKWENA